MTTTLSRKQLPLLLISAALLIFGVLLATRIMASETRVCAQSSYAPAVEVTFQNTTDENMDIYWVDFDCEEQLYFSLTAGQTQMQLSYVTHPWIVRRAYSGEAVACIITDGPGIVQIGDGAGNTCQPLSEQ